MSVLIEDITEVALSLPIGDRAVLADRLFDSLSPIDEKEDIRDAWVDVARRRLEDVKSGKSKTIDGPTGLAQVRRAIRK